ncbi:MAG: hypothetical protein ACOC3T_00805, partial [Bacteroidota bacterium]
NALAKFLGYFNWLEFYKKNEVAIHKFDTRKRYKSQEHNFSSIFSTKNIKYGIIAVFLTSVIIGILILVKTIYDKNEYNHVKFIAQDSVGIGLPYIATFEYDISGLQADSVYIEYRNEHSLLRKDQKIKNLKIFTPGLITFKLKAGEETIKTTKINVQTDGWAATMINDKGTYYVFNEKDMFNDSTLCFPHKILEHMNLSFEKTSYYYFNKRLSSYVSNDNFSFEARVKLFKEFDFELNNIIQIGLTFSNGFIEVPLTKDYYPGITLYLNEKTISSRYNDLRGFITPITNWCTVFFKTREKYVSIYVNNNLAYEGKYKQPLGHLMGIRIWFRRLGAIDYFKLYNNRNELVLDEDFND